MNNLIRSPPYNSNQGVGTHMVYDERDPSHQSMSHRISPEKFNHKISRICIVS